MKTAT
ncbi:hypothetical protein EC34870_3019A, partial [Escherichia coli 3.4870]